jgi:hypothetical protein
MMKTIDKKAAREAYKSRVIQHGIVAIRCTATGQAWVGATTQAGIGKNAIWTQLRFGVSHNKKMQAAWSAHGEDSFVYELVETFDTDLSPHQLQVQVIERLPEWKAKLNALPLP